MDAFKDGLIQFLGWLVAGSGVLLAGIATKEAILSLRNKQARLPKFSPALESDKNKSRRTPMVK